MNWEERLKGLRREPMASAQRLEGLQPLDLQPGELLPHRGSMLLVDEFLGWDREEGLIAARRRIGEDHLGLDGHFPGDPILPGVLLLEMMGQAGTALFQMLLREEAGVEEGLSVRATKIKGAHFLREVRPGEEVVLAVRALEWDTFLGECEAQALVEGEVAAVMCGEVLVL